MTYCEDEFSEIWYNHKRFRELRERIEKLEEICLGFSKRMDAMEKLHYKGVAPIDEKGYHNWPEKPKTYTMKCGGRIVNTWTEPYHQCFLCKFLRYSHEAKEHGCYRLAEGKYWCVRSRYQDGCEFFEEEVEEG